ncbi:putative transcription factor interactor and regulator CCHC(Zn) family [Helianthus annuus]|nr:putative transcription factor interactor and regulator CCHC(Zn) family [Helianthus annuus]
MLLNNRSPKVGTAFSTDNAGESSKNKSSGCDSGYHSSSSSSKTNPSQNWNDSPNLNPDFAKQKMSFLASILESYEGLIAGKIGNPNMTKEDYDQADPEEMELIDIRWCMASVIKRAQRFMEITGRKCWEGPDMKIGFDKAKITCYNCKQKGHFKRECTNNKADDSVNPFHEDYYKKVIYHRNNEQPSRTNQKQIEEGSSSKERNKTYVTFQEDEKEGFDWSKYIKDEEKEKKALVAEFKHNREEHHARMYLSDVYDAYKEAKWATRWSIEKECYVDLKGNPTIDPDKVDFEALVATIPTVGIWCKGLEEIPRYREKIEEGIRKVIYASLEKKKKTVEEIVDESKKMVVEVTKADEKLVDEALAEEQNVKKEDQKQTVKEAEVPDTEVIT